ncbi:MULTISPECIES: amino acid ABC transporter permease [Rhizobium]|jgi:general L-amino acid transport system permease protein|uniref:Amino acid ABC transporter permease n=1 Tax=Rhizobium anhuiense TaxID=1184720 RepID=A0A3S0SM82_9HYPH|nr:MULTISPECIES: amino acid ABC transporter permease [Rhizobium]KZS51424.1 amino acid ABC transporter permease [Rhizobium anhuiense bv. trifolii]MBB3299634.1 general L-amino acid transport system permease protein [Rhizobium sp. BK112]MBB3369098.1 general L-amino acid transport system permease protein [Rhizobium sp. BK077]MBB3743961.1 general L-amino acid transport system permease protein [Rhizobium sp. BK591]MBB4113584.1 general L-amino acid transport system permease protein [Rhizobium sp. BK2
MSVADKPFVRTSILAAEPPPPGERGAVAWIRRNLLATPKDIILTILAVALIAWAVPQLVNWLFIQAVWSGPDRTFCATTIQGGIQPDGWSGACWAFVSAKYDQFIFGRYPLDERWRPAIVGILFIVLLVPMLIPSAPRKGLNAILLFAVLPVIAFWLLHGGFGLEVVDTPLWGGLMVTLVLSFVGIAVSLPCGILLALGRRSKMPVIRMLCVTFIEVIRGVPLITVLFMASVMLPLFLPTGWNVDKLLRALIGVSIFTSAYMAEVIRGGLQAIPKGQFEGADSLGLGYWQKTRLIIMPQAIKLVIPSIVNTFIGTFKDTSLVTIIGMFDLLGIVKLNFSDANWASAVTPITGLIFAGFIFWLFCFGMSRYSGFMERHLDTGHKR